MHATAIAHPNIALIKYWGKRDSGSNLPAVGSLSITLDALHSRTSVTFDSARRTDSVLLNGQRDPEALRRVSACLDLLRRRSGTRAAALVETENDFPTGAGLASSASGFAALAVAAAAALELELPLTELAEVARIGSGSAPRSLFGGFVLMRNLPAGGLSCEPWIAPAEWPLKVIIAVTSVAAKDVDSRSGMTQSSKTSPFYGAWLRDHDADLACGMEFVRRHDFAGLAEIAQHNCLKMHAVMLTTRPPLIYWEPATLACVRAIQELQRAGTPVFFTIDAGPQVKAVCLPEAAPAVRAAVAAVPGVLRVIESGLGSGARLSDA